MRKKVQAKEEGRKEQTRRARDKNNHMKAKTRGGRGDREEGEGRAEGAERTRRGEDGEEERRCTNFVVRGLVFISNEVFNFVISVGVSKLSVFFLPLSFHITSLLSLLFRNPLMDYPFPSISPPSPLPFLSFTPKIRYLIRSSNIVTTKERDDGVWLEHSCIRVVHNLL